ncbi:hypothetical protein, partial [Paraburkholderia sabiae]|uniref:hypothetical protein n=1 Tax=Paraburkholderia sabiae TaxID=273251 RepID=UPI001CC78DBF
MFEAHAHRGDVGDALAGAGGDDCFVNHRSIVLLHGVWLCYCGFFSLASAVCAGIRGFSLAS